MKKRKRNRLPVFLVLSLLLHLGAYSLVAQLDPARDDSTDILSMIPLIQTLKDALPKPPEPEPKSPDEPVEPPDGTPRFRPNDDVLEPAPEQAPVDNPTPQQPPEPPRPQEPPQPPEPEPAPAAPEPEALAEAQPDPQPNPTENPQPDNQPPPEPPRMTPDDVDVYRRQLLGAFDPEWARIPDLHVRASGDVQREVGRYFDMKLIAYPKGVTNPTYVILIDEDAGRYQYTHDFDFKHYSNRIKDRSHVRTYARLVERAKSKLALPEDLTIASLVPAKADAYFAAKQMEAVRAAQVPPEQVRRTEGRYGRDARGRYCLIIQRVILKDGRVLEVDDPERTAVDLL